MINFALQMQSTQSVDQALGALLIIIGSPIVGYLILKLWGKQKDRSSPYYKVQSLKDVGYTFLSLIGQNRRSAKALGTHITLYPTWGVRVVTTVSVLFFAGFVWHTSRPDYIALNGDGLMLPMWGIYAFSLLLGYSLFAVWFGQKTSYDDREIKCRFVQLLPQQRQLDTLYDIVKHPRNPVYVLHFDRQKPMHVFSYMTQREQFLADMNVIIDQNHKQLGVTRE